MELPNPKQIRWHCRRGMLELDLLLIPFFDDCFSQLTPAQQKTFVELLDCPDPDLMAWLSGQATADDPDFQKIIHLIRDNGVKT